MFEAPFMRLALLASIAASVPLSVLGVFLVARRVVFLGLVLANAATVGAALAEVLGWPTEIAAMAAAVVTAVVLGALPEPRRVPTESLVGWGYAATSALTVLILAGAARADADTLHLLYGNVLAVNRGHALILTAVAVAVVLLHGVFHARFLLVTFDAEAATVAGVRTRLWSMGLNLSIGIAAATTVHEIGALLTFALLTLPPMASLLVAGRIHTAFLGSALIGIAGVWLGLMAAYQFDLPPGPVSVAVLAAAVVVAAIAAKLRA